MDIHIATLCDFATDYNGKLVISGTFDTLVARQLPVVHPQCSLAMRICMTDDDNGTHQFSVAIIDQDGNVVDDKMPIEAEMPIKIPEGVPFITRNLVMNLQGLKFKELGVYSIDVKVDQELVARIPLRILKAKQKTNDIE